MSIEKSFDDKSEALITPEKIYGKILEKCWENLGPDHYSARSCSVIRRSRDFIDLYLRAR